MYRRILEVYENEVAKNTKNKRKVYQFEKNKMQNIELIYNSLQDENYQGGRYNIFLIKYPKYRIVMSLSMRDKVINHYFTRYVLMPKLTKYLDDRNVATRKGMGTQAGINYVKKFLEKNKKYDKFYILKIDISKYFYSIDHNILKKMLKSELSDFEYRYVEAIINSTNLSYINDSIKYLKEREYPISERKSEIEKIPYYSVGKGLPIGNMSSQFLSIFYLNALDHKIIHDFHVKHYVRYMDDFLLIHPDKKHLEYCLKEIQKILEDDYKLAVNKNKTKIYSNSEGFEFLGYRFRIYNKKTIMTLRKDTIVRMKKRVKEVNYLYKNNKMTFESAFSSINNFLNTYQGSRERTRRIIEKYWFNG